MLRASVPLLAALLVAAPARAQVTEIWKCKGADGHWTYTNDRNEAERQKCEIVTRQVNVAPAQKPPPQPARSARQGDFPKETPAERASARERQREILEKELATEQAALAKAKQQLAEQEQIRSGDERNY